MIDLFIYDLMSNVMVLEKKRGEQHILAKNE